MDVPQKHLLDSYPVSGCEIHKYVSFSSDPIAASDTVLLGSATDRFSVQRFPSISWLFQNPQFHKNAAQCPGEYPRAKHPHIWGNTLKRFQWHS